MLVVNSTKPENEEGQYLHQGLALRPFARGFELADHFIVEGAKLDARRAITVPSGKGVGAVVESLSRRCRCQGLRGCGYSFRLHGPP
jgi:hypothetical protein